MTINGSLEYDFDWLETLKGLKLRFSYAKSIGNTEGRQLGSKYDGYYLPPVVVQVITFILMKVRQVIT